MPGGEGGIRTPGTVTRTPHFECGAFNHSATSPWRRARERQPALCKQAALTKQERSRLARLRSMRPLLPGDFGKHSWSRGEEVLAVQVADRDRLRQELGL